MPVGGCRRFQVFEFIRFTKILRTMEAQFKTDWKQFEDLQLDDQGLLLLKGGDGEDDGDGVIIDDIIIG